jgi:RNA polymerase sigma-70 factor, ECF subfamily
VIVLAYYAGLSNAEIATLLALPPGTVKGRMRLGLQKLRDQLEGVSSPAGAP